MFTIIPTTIHHKLQINQIECVLLRRNADFQYIVTIFAYIISIGFDTPILILIKISFWETDGMSYMGIVFVLIMFANMQIAIRFVY